MLSEAGGTETRAASPAEGAALPVHRSAGRPGKLTKKSEFDEVKASGLKWNDPLFIFLAVPAASGEETRCGIICSRRFDKRAVVRNRARRLLWEAFRLSKERFPPCRIVMIPRRRICLEKMETVKTHLEALLPWLAKVLGNACADADS